MTSPVPLAMLADDAAMGDALVTGFAIDHRVVQPGDVFGAFVGAKVNGEAFIDDAVRAGAVAIVARPDTAVAGPAKLIADADPRRRFAALASRFHGPYPPTRVAVTGTNGKTSVVDIVRQLWTSLGLRAASLGTLGVISADGRTDMGMTSPDIVTFLKTMQTLGVGGHQAVAFEASSHGLDQHRVGGPPLQAAAFTNLSRDHLDYHGDMERYFAAKARLFTQHLAADGVAVLWADDPWSARIEQMVGGRNLLRVGVTGAELRLTDRRIQPAGQALAVAHQGIERVIHLPLIGAYQAANALVAAGLLLATGQEANRVFAGLEGIVGVPGRLQLAATTTADARLYVDYAHTPDGLRAAIDALRPHAAGRLIVVFGCGGDRDAGKRPLMGRIAAELADGVIVTDDNPRSEPPAAIRASILAAAPCAREIGDRAEAIHAAARAAGPGDIVLIAGKGHEQGQIVGDRVLPFDDVAVAREAAR